MTAIQGFLLGILQGIAEFLPISSSGHLKAAQHLFGLGDVPLIFDVLLHIATLAAVVIYFRKVIGKLFAVLFRMILRRAEPAQPFNINSVKKIDTKIETLAPNDEIGRKTILMIIVTTLITGVLGIASSKLIPELPLKFVAAGFIATALFLVVSAFISKKKHGDLEPVTDMKDDFYSVQENSITLKQAVVIGIAQGIGTLPGISRSGSTIAGAQFCGVNRQTAGDYSFIVSIPAILGAFVLTLKDAFEEAGALGTSVLEMFNKTVGIVPAAIGFAAAFVFGYIALALLMKIINKGKLEWFAVYLVPLGILGLIFF